MKKLVALLIALVLSVFSAVGIADVTPVDRPSDVKIVEWAVGYHRRCRAYHGKLQPRYGKFVRKVALAPMHLLIGSAIAETSPDERYWGCAAKGGTPEEALTAYNAADESEVPKPKASRITHPRWAKVDPERVGFLSAESLTDVTSAKRGWFSAAALNGFDATTVLQYQWFQPDAPEPITEPPESIVFKGTKYMLHCASQGGVKKGAAIYLTRKFLYTETNSQKNHILLSPPDGLPINKENQIKALRFTGCEQTEATMKNVVVFAVKRRTDDASTIVDKRPVVHVDVPNGYKRTVADKVAQALDDGGGIAGPKSGIKGPVAQLRNNGGIKCAVIKYLSKFIGKIVLDVFGCEVEITEESILLTTDNTKDIKPFLDKMKSGEMTGEQAKAAWLAANGGPDGPIYECPIHPQNNRVKLGRQIFGKLSQLSDDSLFRVMFKDLGKLANLGFESGYKRNLQRKYAALKLPALASILDHPLLYKDTVREYLSRWHDIASGGIEVDGALALAVIDPAWFDDVYVGGMSVDDPTAGVVKAGTVFFGVSSQDKENPYLGKKLVLGRFPQVKSGLPVVKVSGSTHSGVIVVSGRPGDMVLQDLDADLDGDKLYVIFDERVVTAVELANKIFNFPHIIFSKWETSSKKETLVEYLSRNAQWQSEESVGNFATHQFVIDEMVPLLEEGQEWRTLLRPTLDENGDYSDFVTLEQVFEYNDLLGVGGNMATDSGKLNHKPDAPEEITKRFAFRPMSQRDAHPNAPDSGFKKRHEAFMPDKYPGVGTNVLARVKKLLMKFVPIEETGKTETNDFSYTEDGRIEPDVPKMLWCPSGFEPADESTWKHRFGNELDEIKTSLVCFPDEAQTLELNSDLQVFADSENGISMVTYFSKYAAKIVDLECNLNDDKKGWSVSARDTFGDNLIAFVRTATKRQDISADDCLWLAYNALCQSFIGTESQSRGTSFAISQFLKLFEGMLIEEVCRNTGEKAPKTFGDSVSIKDSVTKPIKEEPEEIAETTTEELEPPFDTNIDSAALQAQLLTEINIPVQTTDEVEPNDNVDTAALLASLRTITGTEDDEVEDEEE